MLLNYLKTIYRDLRNNKLYAFISVFGLAVGISVSVVLTTIVVNYFNHDKFHEKGDRIYQTLYRINYDQAGEEISWVSSCLLGDALVSEIPEIKSAVTLTSSNVEDIFIVGDKKFKENGTWANQTLFSIFSFPVIAKTSDSVFADFNSIAISETLAKKYFDTVEKALGQRVTLRSNFKGRDVYVSSVFKDIPSSSSIKFDFAMPIEFFMKENSWAKTWGNKIASVYIEVNENIDLNLLNNKIKDFIKTHHGGLQTELFLYKYENMFLDNPCGSSNNKNVMFVLIAVAVSILIVASINFVNLSISRTTKKTKEVGLRKVIGANRGSIITRFMGEAFVITVLSIFLSLFFAEVFISYINSSFPGFLKVIIPYNSVYFYLLLLLITIIVSLLSGIYPALFLSSFSPVGILKGSNLLGTSPLFIRKALMMVQFVFSGLFIIASVVSLRQLNLIQNKDLGVNINHVLSFEFTISIENHLSAFKNGLLLNSNIASFTSMDFQPTGVYSSTSDPYWEGKPDKLNDMFPTLHVSDGFVKTFDAHIIKGRDFEDGDSVDVSNFIINEKMAEIIGKDNPIGLGLSFWGQSGQIIGVVKNFHINNLMTKIGPLIIIKNPSRTYLGFVKFNIRALPDVIKHIKKTYEKYESEYPLTYSFLKEDFIKQHSLSIISTKFNSLFAIIAVIISCLGLIGLTAFTTEQKTKEIGIRKVLGAPVFSIIYMLSKGLLRLVILSFITSIPLGYYFMKTFLEDFAYKAQVGADVFICSFIILLSISFITVLMLSLKAANANPIESLRSE